MKLKVLFILTFLPVIIFSQKLTRNVFEYDKLKTENFVECDENIKIELENVFIAIQENNSSDAVQIAKKMYTKKMDCYQIFEAYGYALFRNGEWFEGVDIIEKGIEKFGSVPELIKRKSEMSLEMAQLGTGQKNIDGNSVFKANSLKYDEEQFKEENFKSALVDLEYLMTNYKRAEEIFYVAKIQQLLKNYDKSTEIFKTLLNDEEYKNACTFNIADNYIAQNKVTEAEIELNKLLAETPKESQIYEKLSEIYDRKKDKIKSEEFRNKAIYYETVPPFLNLEYSKINFDLLKFFGTDENKSEKKIKKLNEILKQNNQDYTIDVCLIILKLHANHGNGIEEKATEILSKIGKPAIEKVNKLFQTDVSTCTITNLADIMATVKDEKSWELMKQYLPSIANMPMTLIPPNLPEKMLQFDEDKGITEILKVVKPLLNKAIKNVDPMAELSSFGQYVYYSPLGKISKEKLKKIATELNYSDKEFEQLEIKIK
jgi:tetratricopeptide (TPR) repeat protein